MGLNEALTALALILLGVDWLQTLQIARNPYRWGEMNALLGEHPSVSRVNVYFALCFAASIGVAWLLWGTVDLALCAAALCAMQAWCVLHNWRNGVRI